MYHEHFGLREFRFTFLLSNTLFLGAAHLEGLAKLEGAFCEPSGLTLLVGEAGTGKTTLIHALLARLNDDKVRVAQLTNPKMSFAQMLGVMIQQIGIQPVGRGKLASLQALKTFLADPASTISVVLIFDEAQRLSDETLEELRLLSDSRPPERHALQIVLVGRPELVQRLTEPKLRTLYQRIGARALLRPLRGAEIHDYVNCFLRAQGALYEVFSRGALVEVACLSGGVPRKINDLCHNSLLLAYSDGSTVVEPQHVRAASVEIEYMLDVSVGQDGQPIEAPRGAIHWMLGRGKPLMAGWLSALVVAGALAVEFGRGPSGAWFARPTNVHRDSARGGGEFSKPLSVGAGQSHEEPRREIQTAPPLRTDQSADHGGGPSAQAPVAYAPHPVAHKGRVGNTGAPIVRITGFQPEIPKTLTSANSASPKPAVTPPPSDNRLTYEQERRLRYEIRRAKSSFGGGNYTNAIYHLKRALLLDPGTSELRDLLQRAQAAQSNPEKGGASIGSSPTPSVAGAWPDYRPEIPSEAPSASASAEGAAPPVPAAETLRLTNRGGPPASASREPPSVAVAWPDYRPGIPSEAPSASASAEVAARPVPAAETLRLTNRGGPPASPSGEPRSVAVARPAYRPGIPSEAPSASASAEVAAPPVPAAETLRLTKRGGPPASPSGEPRSVAVARPAYRAEIPSESPSASASAEGAARPVPAAETLRLTNRGGSPASASGELAATPDSAASLPSASTENVPAGRAVFNIQIQAAMDQKNANQIVGQLRQLGYHPNLVSTWIGGHTWYKVEIGPYASQNEAASAKAELRLKYNSAFDPPAPILGDDSPDLLLPFSPKPLRIGLSTELSGN